MEKIKQFELEKLKKIQIFTGAQLKYIAFISMLIDHVNNAIVTSLLDGSGFLLYLSNIFSILGRIAFPIFVFFIVTKFQIIFILKNKKINKKMIKITWIIDIIIFIILTPII